MNLDRQTIEEIENIISEKRLRDLHSFIKYAVRNQIELEKEGIENPRLELSLQDKNSEKLSFEQKNFSHETLKIEPKKVDNLITLDLNEVKNRTTEPIWTIKNRYFPIKFVLRFLQHRLGSINDDGITIEDLKESLLDPSLKIREDLEKLDDLLNNKRGKKISTGFPKNKKNSYTRFFKNFVVYKSKRENSIDGLPYQLGFVNVDGNILSLTKKGYKFSNLKSPILDGYYINKEKPSYQFSKEELQFLYNHILNYTTSEKDLILFMTSILEGDEINTPSKVNKELKPYLEDNYPKEGGYTDTSINSIRSGLISRMSEIKLIKIINRNGGSVYELTDKGKKIGDKYGG